MSGLLLECHAGNKEALKSHLQKYNLRSALTISDVSNQFQLGYDIVEARARDERANTNCEEFRYLIPLNGTSDDIYLKKRIERCIAEGPDDLIPGSSLPLECNLDLMGAIDFNKGCYLGQGNVK